jgi:hypothetical protein
MRTRVFSVAIILAALFGCSYIYGPVKEVDAYIAVKEPTFEEMGKIIKAEPTEAGVDKAVKLWESKKTDLKAKFDAIQAAPQGKNSDWQLLYFKSQDRTKEELRAMETGLSMSNAPETAKSKFKALQKEIDTTLRLS